MKYIDQLTCVMGLPNHIHGSSSWKNKCTDNYKKYMFIYGICCCSINNNYEKNCSTLYHEHRNPSVLKVRGNVVLGHSVAHFPPNSGGIVCSVA